ncbi:amidase signature enzyme [Meredithblackwellia eburnea MCA 4105]
MVSSTLSTLLLAQFFTISIAAPAPIFNNPPLQQNQVTFSPPKAEPLRRPSFPRLEDASITTLLAGLSDNNFTSAELTQEYLDRINIFDDIRATLVVNPSALEAAKLADATRAQLDGLPIPSHLPLLGIPFLVKDNIAIPASVGPTTAGSFALVNTTVSGPSKVVERLIEAGAILLGTTNLDEFAQAKGDHPWGWSARGGQMHSIYGNDGKSVAIAEGYGDVCGSSGGSALSVALGLAAFSLGTQTGVSIVCPAGRAGIVGLKPGRGGMTPMAGVIPISKHLDVVGPLTRTVEDAETVWRVIKHPAGWTEDEDPSFTAITGRRKRRNPSESPILVGVPKNVFWDRLDDMPEVTSTFAAFVDQLKLDPRFEVVFRDVVNISQMTDDSTFSNVSTVTAHELKVGINHYLQNWTLVDESDVHSLGDIIDFNIDHAALELPPGPFPVFGHPPRDDESYSDQSFLIKANSLEHAGWKNATYRAAKLELERIGWVEGFEPYFWSEEGVDIMLVPTEGISGTLASLSAVPQITLPFNYYPTNYTLESNATWPIYPYPSMPFGVSLLAPRGHDSHEFLLKVARMVEGVMEVEDRRDKMRDSVRNRLVKLEK